MVYGLLVVFDLPNYLPIANFPVVPNSVFYHTVYTKDKLPKQFVNYKCNFIF